VSTFRRPIGANADVKELEYIAALHQTSDDEEESFVDGSIEAKDVKYYLMSRYGIEVNTKQVQKLIFHDLAGGSAEEECMDICELVAILLIPFFVKHIKGDAQTLRNHSQSIMRAFSSDLHMQTYMQDIERCNSLVSKGGVIQHVLNIILTDSTGSSEPRPITKELLQTIFTRYGELELSQDEQLIEEMVLNVSGGDENAIFDADTFARALTEDVMLYDIDNESRVSTFYEDVFGRRWEKHHTDSENNNDNSNDIETDPLNQDMNNSEDPELNIEKKEGMVFRNVFTLSQVDFLADSCQSKLHLTMVYLAFVFSIYKFENNEPIIVCPYDNFGCQIANSVTFWLIVVGIMVGVGTSFILSLSIGNTLRGNTIKTVVTGLAGIVLFVVIPSYVSFSMAILTNEKDSSDTFEVVFIRVVLTSFAVILFIIQIMNLIRIIKPAVIRSRNRIVAYIFTRGTVRDTFLLKLACSLKTHMMVKNALDLHFEGGNLNIEDAEPILSSTNALALLNYDKNSEKTETIGGLLWCWKGFITKSLVHKEGVMVNSRLILCNALQFFTAIVIFANITSLTIKTERLLVPNWNHHEECNGFKFDPDKCVLLELAHIPSGMALCYGVTRDENTECFSEKYFEPLTPEMPGEFSSGTNHHAILNMLCRRVDDLVDDVNGMIWSLINQALDSQVFVNVSTQVVGTSLCLGLTSLNHTVWEALGNRTTPATFESCNVPQESFCNATVEEHAVGDLVYESAMNSLVESYEDKYKKAMQPVVECLEKSNNDMAINFVLGQATGSLQNALGETMQSSWSIPFQKLPDANEAISTDSVNDQITKWINTNISPDLAEQLNIDNPILNDTGLVSKISNPVLSSTPDIVQIQDAANSIIDVMFVQLNTTLIDLKKAADTNLMSLPSYLNLPTLPSSSLCQSTWLVRPNVFILAETEDSTPNNYCRAHLTACTNSGICLLGLDISDLADGTTKYYPFQFSGGKCYDHPLTKEVIESKEDLGALKLIIPSPFVVGFSLTLGGLLSVLALLGVAFLFIPNVILTSLKYRSGVLPSLKSEAFRTYRYSLISLTYLVPITFWSALVMTFTFFFLFSLFIFFLIWDQSRKILVRVTATLIGK